MDVPGATSSDEILLYREEQHFRQVWLWLIVLGSTGLMWYTFISQIFLRRPIDTFL